MRDNEISYQINVDSYGVLLMPRQNLSLTRIKVNQDEKIINFHFYPVQFSFKSEIMHRNEIIWLANEELLS